MKPNMNQTMAMFLDLIREEVKKQQNGGRRKREPRPHALGVIASDYPNDGSRPMVVMDGDPVPIGPFPYLVNYVPAAGDRVLLARAGKKYVIEGKII